MVSPQARTKARRAALQALYQWQMAGQDIAEIKQQFYSEQDFASIDQEYFEELIESVPKTVSELNDYIIPFIDREVSSLDPVELAILRIGCYELRFRLDIPYRVVINESVELAKRFGAEQSHKYINGVLDKIAHELRAQEIK